MTAFTCSSSVNGEEKRLVQGLLNSFGLVGNEENYWMQSSHKWE